MKKTILILSALVLVAGGCSQKTDEQIEKELVEAYKSITLDLEDWDKRDTVNKAFKKILLDYTSNYPSTLTSKFDLLKEEISIASSEDSLFRIYSWNTYRGGSMQDFENVFQFKSGNNIYAIASKDGNDGEEDGGGMFDGSNYSQIFTVKADNRTYYLAISNNILSGKDASQSIKAFTIENNSLNDNIELFKTKTKLLNNININFDFRSVDDRPEPLNLIKYDPEEKIVYIPIVIDDIDYESGKVTDRYIIYQFNGQYFEYKYTQEEIDKYVGIYEYAYPYGSEENQYIVLTKRNGKIIGFYYGTSDEFDDAREGYPPGFFVVPMNQLEINKDTIQFVLNVKVNDMLTKPIDLQTTDNWKLKKLITSTQEAKKAGYKNWEYTMRITDPKKYNGFISVEKKTILFKKESNWAEDSEKGNFISGKNDYMEDRVFVKKN